jgi:hypothetical protein
MALPVFRRFSLQDIPDAPNWIEQIITPLNLFCETTVTALNKNLTVGQNLQGAIYSTTFTTVTNYTAGTFTPIIFAYNGGGQPKNVIIGNLNRVDGELILTPFSLTAWHLNINTSPFTVNVDYIAGLNVGVKYNVTFFVV